MRSTQAARPALRRMLIIPMRGNEVRMSVTAGSSDVSRLIIPMRGNEGKIKTNRNEGTYGER